MEKNKSVTLLCGKGDCCPKVIIKKDQVVITDDYGGRVKLTHKEYAILKEKIKIGKI